MTKTISSSVTRMVVLSSRPVCISNRGVNNTARTVSNVPVLVSFV